MAKKNTRKPSGAAAITVIEDDLDNAADDGGHESNWSSPESEPSVVKPQRKAKAVPQSNGAFAVSDIKKAAAFANSVGGLDKALAVLQILKVAKEVQ
jgi:hypothetical protein